MRSLRPWLADVGLDAERLSDTARRLARAAAAIDRMVDDLEATAATDHGGVFSVATAALAAAPDEVALRLLARLMGRVRPSDYGPRAAALEAFQAELAAGGGGRRTLAGVTLDARADRVWIYAEAGRRGFPVLPVSGPGILVWDGRFEVDVGAPLPDGSVVAAAAGDERRGDLPKAAAATLPVLRLPPGSGSLRSPDGALEAPPVTIRPLRR